MVMHILRVFHFDVYTLLDLGENLYFVIPGLAMKFNIRPKILLEPFSVYTPVSDSILATDSIEIVQFQFFIMLPMRCS